MRYLFRAQWLKKQWKKIFALCISSVVILFSFQNCGQAGFENSGEFATKTEELDPKIVAAPMAYSANANQITYMSCVGKIWGKNTTITNRDTFFTFRVGAFDNTNFQGVYPNTGRAVGGVQLSAEFLSYLDKNFKPPYGSKDMDHATPDQLKEVLQKSPMNSNALLQLAIRPIDNPQYPASSVIRRAIKSTGTLDLDYMNFFAAPLSSEAIVADFATATTATHRYFRYLDLRRAFDASLYFNQGDTNEDVAREIRDALGTADMVTLSYTPDLDKVETGTQPPPPYAARGPASGNNRIYGTGYRISFTQGTNGILGNGSGMVASSPTRALSTITEVDLTAPSQSNGKPWTCPQRLRYVIVSQADAAKVCPPMSIAELAADPYAVSDLSIMTRHLKANLWRINTARRCVVPREGSCYPETAADPIEYDTSKECLSGNTGDNKSANHCAHYVSVCLRTDPG